ncbi:hypothetical protein E2C01_042363 [Portunus trituberculatus]|uniref:Uncharacterized protein n=1 Tax=Portunus trituberculatus TaxID=210409 RepID=A0A5B7FSV9_PORTR|nr:hypothetical protein [Portunus trituberculatus]
MLLNRYRWRAPMMSSDVEDERLELHCRVVRVGEVADTRQQQVAAVVRWIEMRVCSSTKLTPKQVVKLEKLLMKHENIFSRGAQDLGCTSLVQHSINTADSPPIKQPHRCVPLAKREEMRIPLDRPLDDYLGKSYHRLRLSV